MQNSHWAKCGDFAPFFINFTPYFTPFSNFFCGLYDSLLMCNFKKTRLTPIAPLKFCLGIKFVTDTHTHIQTHRQTHRRRGWSKYPVGTEVPWAKTKNFDHNFDTNLVYFWVRIAIIVQKLIYLELFSCNIAKKV